MPHMNYVSFEQFEVDTQGTVTTVCRRLSGVQRGYCRCIGPGASIIAPSDRGHGVLEVSAAAAAGAGAVRRRGAGWSASTRLRGRSTPPSMSTRRGRP